METKRKKKSFEEKRKAYGKSLQRWFIAALVVMLLCQGVLQYNRHKIHWIDGKYTDVSLSQSGELIIVVNSQSGLAGALNLKGEEIIPVRNSVFDPWDGSLINGMRQDGNLFWVIQDNQVGIVNAKNETVIPMEYGYLEKTQEDQFIAGTGQISNAVASGGVYTYQKYGVITESGKVLIPLEYDSLKLLDDSRYEGVIEEDTRTITRIFYASGNLETEEVKEKKAVSEEDGEEQETESEEASATPEDIAQDQQETAPEEQESEESTEAAPQEEKEAQEEGEAENADKEALGEDSGVEEYEGPGDYEVINYYTNGDSTRIHLSGTVCTLEDEYGNVLAQFEGDRVQETVPEFQRQNQLVVDEGENFYRIYNALTGILLCDVKKEADCVITDHLITYEQTAEYIVKNFNNTEIFRTQKGDDDQFLNAPNERARFVFQKSYFVYQADEGRTLITNSGVVVAQGLDSVSFNDENNNKENTEDKIFICEKDGKYGAFNAGGDKILDFLYENIEFFNGHENGLRVTQDKNQVGIVDYTGQVIIPLEYDSVGYGNYIEEASDNAIVEYELINSRSDSYYGKIKDSIYYLDNEGNKTEEVWYVKSLESDRDLNDYLSMKQIQEAPKEYRTTGNLLVMDNAYSGGLSFGRSTVYKSVEKNRIRFLLSDENNSKIGVWEYYFGDFTLMGYQHWFWYTWMLSSRIGVILLLLLLVMKIPYEEISDRVYFWKKELEGKKAKKKKSSSKKEKGKKHEAEQT